MKTLNTLLTFSLLVIGTASFAGTDGLRSEKNTNVPVAPSVWSGSEIEAPESLKFLKAKNAFVPVAPFIAGDPMEKAPEELALITAGTNFIPVAPFIWGDPTDAAPELLLK